MNNNKVLMGSVCICIALVLLFNIIIITQNKNIIDTQKTLVEQSEVQELFVCANNANGFYNSAINKLKQRYPWVDVRFQGIDVSTGKPATINALIAADTPPDLYEDYIARSGWLMVPEYALNYVKYCDLSDFIPDVINQMKKGTGVYGLPRSTRAVGMFVNTDLTGPIPQNWTVDDFLVICEKIKSKGKTPYVYFAANPSSCEWLLGWFPAFGCEFFQNGDYTKTTIRSTGGEKVFAFLLELLKAGYIPKESAVLSDDDAQAGFLNETYAMSGSYIGSWDAAIQSQIEQGILDKAYNYEFHGFPSAIGRKTPVIATYHAVVTHISNSEYKNKVMAYFAECMTNLQETELKMGGSSFASRKSVTTEIASPHWKMGNKLQKENGLFDVGISIPAYAGIRPALSPVIQALFNGKISALEAVIEYEKAINKAIAETL